MTVAMTVGRLERWTHSHASDGTGSPSFSSSAHVSALESLALSESPACQQLGGLTKWSPTPEWNVVKEQDLL